MEVVARAPESAAPDPADTSASVTVIDARDPTLPPGADLGDALGAAPGVHVRRLGGLGDFTTATLRGSTARQVEVFLDGIPLNPDGMGVIDLSQLPLSGLERIEVYRGNAPAWLGAAAIGGVLNLVTAGADLPPPRFDGSFGSYWTRRLHGSAGWAPVPGVEVRASVDSFGTRGDFTYFDDRATVYNLFDDRTRVRENNDKQDLSVLLRLRAERGPLTVTVQDGFYARDEGIPGRSHGSTDSSRLGTLRNLAFASVAGELPRSARGDVRVFHHFRQYRFEDPEGELGTGSYDARDRYHDAGLGGRVRLVPLPWLAADLSAAVRVDTYTPHSFLEDPPSDGTRARVAGRVSAEGDLSLLGDRLRVTPVLELRLADDRFLGEVPYTSLPVAPQDQAVHAWFTPRAGLRARPVRPLTVKVNAGRYARLPDLVELFGHRGAILGNTDLVPETGLAADVGLRLQGEKAGTLEGAAVEATFFASRTSDLIVYAANGQRLAMPLNLGDARVLGVEAGVQGRLLRRLSVGADVTWTRSENLSDDPTYAGNRIPHLPEWELEARAALDLPWVRLGYDLSFTAGTYEDAANWFLAPPRVLHGAFLRLQPGPRWPFFAAEVRNLTDEQVAVVPANPLDEDSGALAAKALTDFTGYPLPGRTFLFTLGFQPPPRDGGGVDPPNRTHPASEGATAP